MKYTWPQVELNTMHRDISFSYSYLNVAYLPPYHVAFVLNTNRRMRAISLTHNLDKCHYINNLRNKYLNGNKLTYRVRLCSRKAK